MFSKVATFIYIGALLLITALIVMARSPNTEEWQVAHDFPVVDCDGYEVWSRADTRWNRTRFFNRENDLVRVTDRLEDWNAVYYNRQAPERKIEQPPAQARRDLRATFWLDGGEVVRFQERGNPFRVAIPGIGTLQVRAGHDEAFAWSGFDAAPEEETGSALCNALALR
jgi:hypothetical protein